MWVAAADVSAHKHNWAELAVSEHDELMSPLQLDVISEHSNAITGPGCDVSLPGNQHS